MAGTGRQQQSTENGSRHVFFVCYSGIGGQPHSNSNHGCKSPQNIIELNVLLIFFSFLFFLVILFLHQLHMKIECD